jgi:predicted alpha/beta superfamily hydrolase
MVVVLVENGWMIGSLQHHHDFVSRWVESRTIAAWLPPHYAQSRGPYPVIYMHDGQNLFDPATAYIGVDWGIDATFRRLIQQDEVPAAIVVGIWNTPNRIAEYMPQKPYEQLPTTLQQAFWEAYGKAAYAYLRFLVSELKPMIDRTYRTRPECCVIMGSSMGGLVSAYALCEYPQVFQAAACLSTHWPAGQGIVVDWLPQALPDPASHVFYFDYGTENLDAEYRPYQQRVDNLLTMAGYRHGENWMTQEFPGEDHSERAWRKRVHIPLTFVLNRV